MTDLVSSLKGDAAVSGEAPDLYGTKSIATEIFAAILGRVSADGYAIAIDGPWGSGKSTLLNHIITEIEQQAARHHV